MAFYYRMFFPKQAFCQLEDIDRLIPFMYLQSESILKNTEENNTINTPPNTIDTAKDPEPLDFVGIGGTDTEQNSQTNTPFTEPQIIEPLSKTPQEKEEPSIIYPKQPDTLFWCIYIAINGYKKYTEIGHRYGNTEIEEKQRIVEMMRAQTNAVKDCPKRITKAQFQEIMSDFMTNKKMTISMLSMFAIYYNMRIWVITPDSWYMDIYSTETANSKTPIKIYQKHGKYAQYGIELTEGDDSSNTEPPNLFRFDIFDLPLKAISNYKNIDLDIIAEKLGIVMEGKYKKQDIYDKIICKINQQK